MKPGRLLVLLAAGSALTILAGCHSTPSLTDKQLEGKHFYQVRCAHCHEENDLGLKPPPPSLRSLASNNILPSGAPATDANLSRVVLNGKGNMPAFAGRFSNEEMAALIAYLRTGLR